MADDLLVTDEVLEDPEIMRRLLRDIIERLGNSTAEQQVINLQELINNSVVTVINEDLPVITTLYGGDPDQIYDETLTGVFGIIHEVIVQTFKVFPEIGIFNITVADVLGLPFALTVPFQATAVPVDFVATSTIYFEIAGGGSAFVDWGDGSPIEYTSNGNQSEVPTGDILISGPGVETFQLITDTFTSLDIIGIGQVTDLASVCANKAALTSFSCVDIPFVTDISNAWLSCSGLTSFPLIDISGAITVTSAWRLCTGLTSFPSLDFSSAISLFRCWVSCTSITSFGEPRNTGNVLSTQLKLVNAALLAHTLARSVT